LPFLKQAALWGIPGNACSLDYADDVSDPVIWRIICSQGERPDIVVPICTQDHIFNDLSGAQPGSRSHSARWWWYRCRPRRSDLLCICWARLPAGRPCRYPHPEAAAPRRFRPTHSRSAKEVLVVIRFAVSTPVNDTVTFPEVSYASSVKVPEYEFPFGLNVTFSVS
jgi:hypothetical protein